jgi:hypothetical protein
MHRPKTVRVTQSVLAVATLALLASCADSSPSTDAEERVDEGFLVFAEPVPTSTVASIGPGCRLDVVLTESPGSYGNEVRPRTSQCLLGTAGYSGPIGRQWQDTAPRVRVSYHDEWVMECWPPVDAWHRGCQPTLIFVPHHVELLQARSSRARSSRSA